MFARFHAFFTRKGNSHENQIDDDCCDVSAVALRDGVYGRGVLREEREVLPWRLLWHEQLLRAGRELLPWRLLQVSPKLVAGGW
jgi:hypothetical protein